MHARRMRRSCERLRGNQERKTHLQTNSDEWPMQNRPSVGDRFAGRWRESRRQCWRAAALCEQTPGELFDFSVNRDIENRTMMPPQTDQGDEGKAKCFSLCVVPTEIPLTPPPLHNVGASDRGRIYLLPKLFIFTSSVSFQRILSVFYDFPE